MVNRINYFTLFVLVFLMVNVCNVCAQIIPTDSSVLTGKLNNGLTYYIRHNIIPKGQADFHLVQKVGSVLEGESQRGLAHFLEHMAFNGTKHFPGNTMIEELEKRGIKFGANINAYTSYDETVYRLTNVPICREGILDTALLVLHDWSGFISNKDEDIDEERGVIREEWRTRSTGYLRVQENQILPKLLAGTPYANRLPIGKIEVINNFKHSELRDYYEKWYRPDLQCIVVVGDVDVNEILTKLKRLFVDIAAPIHPEPRSYYRIPNHKTPIVAIASDPEIRNTSATVYWKQNKEEEISKSSVQYFKIELINSIISNMMNQRFLELMKKIAATHQITGRMAEYSVVSSAPAWVLNIDAPSNDILSALKIALRECERIRRFGFNKNEFEPTIKNFNLITNESDYYDRKNKSNSLYVQELIGAFLQGRVSPSLEWKYKTTKEILGELSMDTLNFYAKKYISNNNMSFEILCPKKQGFQIPYETDVTKLWDEVMKMDLKPWMKNDRPNDLENLKSPISGKVISVKNNSEPFGYTKWVLSNGVKIWFKKTGYRESELFISGYKSGGYSLVNVNNLPSALSYNQLSQVTNGFEGVYGRATVNTFLNKDSEVINARGTIMNAKILFQNVYMKMGTFNLDRQDFDNWKAKKLEEIKSRSTNPKTIYADTLIAIMGNHHSRALSLNELKNLNRVSYENIISLHKERFGNANEFTFIITGNLSEDSARVLAETWLGGLPSSHVKETIVDHHMYPPKGIIKKHFSREMETPQSTITIGYTGKIPYTIENKVLIVFCTEILKMIYMEKIREKEGGSYGVRVDAELLRYPQGRYIFQVNFDTDPETEKKNKLIGIIYQEIQNIIQNGPDQSRIDRIKQSLLRDYREDINKENAEYWNGMAGALLTTGIDWRTTFNKVVASISSEMIKKFAKNIFNQGNIIEIQMDPS